MTSLEHPGIRKVITALLASGSTAAAAGVRMLDAEARTAAQAAALGVSVGAIANSLVFDADGDPILARTSGAHRADTTRLAAVTVARRVRRANPAASTPAEVRSPTEAASQPAVDDVVEQEGGAL